MAQAVKTNIVPEGYQKAQLYEGDTMAVVNLREVFIYPQVKFKNKREQAKYNKLVRDVKRTLPYAKMVYDTLIETYEYMETLPNDKARQAHLKRMEKELFAQYKPELKNYPSRKVSYLSNWSIGNVINPVTIYWKPI